MKVQCDVCAAEAASVFCCADEAALCDACDRRVHRANKLAGKHRRLSLLHPSPSSQQTPPVCDICQEKRGFLFCKEDRAILCRECDVSVHMASEMTMRHGRFLLTGVRLSSAPVASPPSEEEEDSSGVRQGDMARKRGDEAAAGCGSSSSSSSATVAATAALSDSSSISEYLIKTLPGWHVEDFLIDDAAAAAAAATTAIDVAADGFYQGEVNQNGLAEIFPTWAPPEQLFYDALGDARASHERWVPQVHTEWTGNKRSRPSFCHW